MILETVLFFLIALVYSSAGFGGGSMYIAVLSQTQSAPAVIRFTSLLCNSAVTANGSYQYYRKGWIALKPSLLLLACSVPFCVWTSTFKLEDRTFFILLAVCLLLGALAMLFKKQSIKRPDEEVVNQWWHYPVSAIIGGIAGLTGIGGGVYISPLLHISNWGSPKHIAALSSLYIFVNSIFSITTRWISGEATFEVIHLWLLGAAIGGGLIGSQLSSSILSQRAIKYLTVAIIIFASLKLLWDKV